MHVSIYITWFISLLRQFSYFQRFILIFVLPTQRLTSTAHVFPNFKCPKRVKDDDPVVEDQDEDEENKEENASDEQDSRGSSSDEESSSDDDAESKEDGKVAAATAKDGHQLSAYELQRLNASDATRRSI